MSRLPTRKIPSEQYSMEKILYEPSTGDTHDFPDGDIRLFSNHRINERSGILREMNDSKIKRI
jgi:hypothetical protein